MTEDLQKDLYKPTSKGKKAVHGLFAVNEEIRQIKLQLHKVANSLRDVIDNTFNTFNAVESCKDTSVLSEMCKRSKESEKQRSMVSIVPKRIEFEFNCLKFYIDFTVVATERDDQSNIKGSIIYGASRTLCFSEYISPNNQNKCKECQRVVRCDNLEDKSLVSFEVTQHGMITSSGKLEGEWWIKEKGKPDLLELHYRTLDLIWKEALDWANEIIVP